TIVNPTIAVSGRDQKQAQAAPAAKAPTDLGHARILERIQRALSANPWPAGGEPAAQASSGGLHVTAEETVQLARELHKGTMRYEKRRTDPSLRPAGALPVEFTFFGYPRADLAGLPTTGKETDE